MAASMNDSVLDSTKDGRGVHDSTSLEIKTFNDHPKFKELIKQTYLEEAKVSLTMQVYLDLSEVKDWWNVTVEPSQLFEAALVRARESPAEDEQIVLPVRKGTDLCMRTLRQLLDKLKTCHPQHKSLTLGIVDEDSNTVYYKITDGLVPPDPPEMIDYCKKKRIRRKYERRKVNFVSAPNVSHQLTEGHVSCLDAHTKGQISENTDAYFLSDRTAKQSRKLEVVVDNASENDNEQEEFMETQHTGGDV